MRLQNRLLARWPLTDETGDVSDYSGNHNTGVINGGVTRGVSGILGDSAYRFNGTDSYVDTGISDLSTELNSFTISAWLKLNTNGITYFASSINNGDDLAIQAAVNETFSQTNTPGAVKLFLRSASGSSIEIYTADEGVNDGSWHHICWTFNPSVGEGIIYIDGVDKSNNIASSNTFTVSTVFENSIPIGARNRRGTIGSFYNGDAYDVMFHSRVLPPAEVNALYERGRSANYSSTKKTL